MPRITLFILLSVPFFTGGCTVALWQENSLDAYHKPALDPYLRLYYASERKDLLVVYRDFSERRGVTSTRAYFLYKNDWRIAKERRPFFVDTNMALRFSPVPVYQNLPVPTPNSSNQLCAVFIADINSLTVYSGERVVSSHSLPVYPDAVGTVERVALTPAAVLVDVTIVGGIICLVALAEDNCDTAYDPPPPQATHYHH